MKKDHEITIMGQKFVLKTDLDEDHIHLLSDYVSDLFEHIQQSAANLSNQNVAVLGALNIAEQMLLREQRTKQLIKDLQADTADFVTLDEN